MILCHPRYNIVVLLSIIIIGCSVRQTHSQICTTPNGIKATCISLYRCRSLIRALATYAEDAIEFVKQSQCTSCPLVCCGPDSNFNIVPVTSRIASVTQPTSILPDSRVCGLQHTDDRHYNDSTAALDEFPWLALIRFQDRAKHDAGFRCGGSLISKRYVLTAANCLKTVRIIATSVRLGEYNFREIVDCVPDSDYSECNDVALDTDIEEIIVHEQYSPITAKNDLGLLRLKNNVPFTDYIRPICLPLPGTTLAEVGQFLFSSGFANQKGVKSGGLLERKKRGRVQLISNEACINFYRNILGKKEITNKHICGKEYDEFTCQGDSGVPLMIANKLSWHQEGIVSFAAGCGPGTITVYTRVTEYLDWIQNKMRP